MMTPERLAEIRENTKHDAYPYAPEIDALLEAYDAVVMERDEWGQHAILVTKFLSDISEQTTREREELKKAEARVAQARLWFESIRDIETPDLGPDCLRQFEAAVDMAREALKDIE